MTPVKGAAAAEVPPPGNPAQGLPLLPDGSGRPVLWLLEGDSWYGCWQTSPLMERGTLVLRPGEPVGRYHVAAVRRHLHGPEGPGLDAVCWFTLRSAQHELHHLLHFTHEPSGRRLLEYPDWHARYVSDEAQRDVAARHMSRGKGKPLETALAAGVTTPGCAPEGYPEDDDEINTEGVDDAEPESPGV